MNNHDDNRNFLLRALLPKKNINKKFKDNKERFRFLNKYYKQPKKMSFMYISITSIILCIIPLIFYLSNAKFNNTFDGWAFWIAGLCSTILFEQIANYHYMTFSKIANKKSIDVIQKNATINKILRSVGMTCWILIVLGITIMIVSKDGTFMSVWG